MFKCRGRTERYARLDAAVRRVIELGKELAGIVSLVWKDEHIAYEKCRGRLNQYLRQKYRALVSGINDLCADPVKVVPEFVFEIGHSDKSAQKYAAEIDV